MPKRKVLVYKYERVQGQTNLEKVCIGGGIFHQFGLDYEELEDGVGNYTTAMVEMSDGTIEGVPVDLVEFKINQQPTDLDSKRNVVKVEELIQNIEKDMKELFGILGKKFPVENIQVSLWKKRNVSFMVWDGYEHLKNKHFESHLSSKELFLIVKQRQILFRDFSGGV